MSIVAFDSGDFTRIKRTETSDIVFHSPLGTGISIKKENAKNFQKLYHSSLAKHAKSFKVPTHRYVYSHDNLWKEIGHAKATKMCDSVIKDLEDYIELAFVSYVIIPKEIQEVEVGGYHCPLKKMKPPDFLRHVSPMFSYMTGWAYCSRHLREKDAYLIDNFSGQMTTAWRDLSAFPDIKIFPGGDECNEFISVADMFAYLTEKKLWDSKMFLKPENVEQVWSSYAFETEVRFIDEMTLSKIRPFSNEQINTTDSLARPMVFINISGIGFSRLTADPRASVAAYACSLEGAFESFDKFMDSSKIRDGDVFVYAGEEAKTIAGSFKDMFDIQVFSFREMREKVANLF
jgi:hypothetical protein